jgi:hypothetical protein
VLENEIRSRRATAEAIGPIGEERLRERFAWKLLGADLKAEWEHALATEALAAAEREVAVARGVAEMRASGLRAKLNLPFRWISGADQETAWLALHAAESDLTLTRPSAALRAEIPALLGKVATRYSTEREPGRSWAEFLTAQHTAADVDRHGLREIKQSLLADSDKDYERLRSFRNILLVALIALIVVTALLAVLPGLLTDWITFCPTVESRGSDSCPVDAVWQVELLGALGGFVTALAALQKLRGYRNPYNLPLVQAAVRVPAGALTGLVGILILQSGAFQLDPAEGNAVVAYAIVFGAAQELVTRLIDQKANSLIEAATPSASSDG